MTSLSCGRPPPPCAPPPAPPAEPPAPARAVTSESRPVPSRPAADRGRLPTPVAPPSHCHHAPRGPPPPVRAEPRRRLRLSPLRPAASAPRSPPRSFQPRRGPAPPRLASTGVPYGDHTTRPTPTLPSAGRAAVRTAGPVTHTRRASAWARESKLEHGRRPPSPRDLSRDLSRVPPNSRIRRREGEGPGPRGAPPALTRQTATDPGATVGVSRLVARRPAVPSAHTASKSRLAPPRGSPGLALRRRAPAARPSSAGVRRASARGGRPSRLRTPLRCPASKAAGSCSLPTAFRWKPLLLVPTSGRVPSLGGVAEKVRNNGKSRRVVVE